MKKAIERRCPCCDRPFEQMRDYPSVEVVAVEVLPIPEAIDSHSEEAIARWLEVRRVDEEPAASRPGVNLTPMVAVAASKLEKYFANLIRHEGKEVSPKVLRPRLERDHTFRWAYSVPGSSLLVSMHDREGEEGVCEVVIHGRGPNLGSAGGPTLQRYGALAAIRYRGRLTGPWREQSLK